MDKQGNGRPAAAEAKKVTVPEVRGRKRGPPLAVVTAYDHTMASLVDRAGVDIILVGDSLGMVVQGLSSTLPVTVEEMCYHGRAVARAATRAHVVGDMPFMSFQVSPAGAVRNAGRMLKEGAFEAVKLEGGEEVAEHVRGITRVGIPVMGHVGLTPQSVHAFGGFRMQGRGDDAAARILADARALEEAGVYAIVLEAIPPDVAEQVTRAVGVPTIGIGAGAACDGQVLVCTDLLGMSPAPGPKFVRRYAELGDAIVAAVAAYAGDVRAHAFPGAEHAYRPNREEEAREAPQRGATAAPSRKSTSIG